MEGESRILLSKALKASGTCFVGESVGVKVVLEDVFQASVDEGRVSLRLVDLSDEPVCKGRVRGSKLSFSTQFPTTRALRQDCRVRFAVFEGDEAVLYSQKFVLAAPPTDEELELARQQLQKEEEARRRQSLPSLGSLSLSSTSAAKLSPRAASTSSSSSSSKSRWKAASPTTSPRPGSTALRQKKQRPHSMQASGEIAQSPKSILRAAKTPAHSFRVGQTVMALCQLDKCWHRGEVRGMSDVSLTIYFDDFAWDQPETRVEDATPLSEELGRCTEALLMSGSISQAEKRTSSGTLGDELEAELDQMVKDIDRDPTGIGLARVTQDFVALREGQMSVRKGAVLEVVENSGSVWVMCATDEDIGNVPAKCLEMLI